MTASRTSPTSVASSYVPWIYSLNKLKTSAAALASAACMSLYIVFWNSSSLISPCLHLASPKFKTAVWLVGQSSKACSSNSIMVFYLLVTSYSESFSFKARKIATAWSFKTEDFNRFSSASVLSGITLLIPSHFPPFSIFWSAVFASLWIYYKVSVVLILFPLLLGL